MTTLFEKRAEKATALEKAIADYEKGNITDQALKALSDEVDELNVKCEQVKTAQAKLDGLGFKTVKHGDDKPAKTLGGHFIKHGHEKLKSQKETRRISVSVPEFKAATDTHVVQTDPQELNLLGGVTVDRDFVRPVPQRLFLTDWLATGTLTTRALTYYVTNVAKDREGDFTTVAEGAKKPQMHFGSLEAVTETMRKIAGFIKVSEEMIDDQDYLVSEINTELLQRLRVVEEEQLLNGDGLETNIKGLMEHEFVQKETAPDLNALPDTIYLAMDKIRDATDFEADGIVINPDDYRVLRLKKDKNDQYLAGGFFQGEYGNGGIMSEPGIWGRKTIITPSIPKGTVLVGSGAFGAKVWRYGGVSVDATNTDQDDFVRNLITIRAEERLNLAVKYPAAFCKIKVTA